MSANPNVLGLDYIALMAFLWMLAAFDYQACMKDYSLTGEIQKHPIWVRLAFLVIGVMAALRAVDITNDTGAYQRIYIAVSSLGISGTKRIEKGYALLNLIISKLFVNTETGFHVLQIIIALFSYYSIERYIEKRAASYGVCLLVFYFLINGGYMSAMRQSTAIAIILFGLDLLKKKKRILFILTVVIAAQFHSTAWIALLFIVIYGKKFNVFVALAIVFGAVALTIVNIPAMVTSILTYGTIYISDTLSIRADAIVMSAMYIALLALRLLLPGRFNPSDEEEKRKEEKTDESFYSFCLVLSLAFTILSLRAPAISRMTLYSMVAGLPYIPNTLNKIEDKKESFDLKTLFCGATWAYSFIALIIRPEWQHLWPYHFFWME